MRRKKSFRFIVASTAMLPIVAAAIVLVATPASRRHRARNAGALVLKKKGSERIAPGSNAKTVIGPNEDRGADSSPDIEAYLQRAYPADEVPMEATITAQNVWATLSAAAHSPGTWQLIGPSKATYPAVLNVLGDGAQYVTAGRVTAMAIGPTCTSSSCRVYVAAAGGGIWRTKKGLSGSPNWEFVSGSFATNAIGSLIIDPTDASGNTLYAGTGEPNVSADSEAGMGIYRSTDGGDTWTLLPGSSQFQGRAVASIAIQPGGSILAGIARAVRGISSVLTGGVVSNNPPFTPFGVYQSADGGATFTNIFPAVPGLTLRGVNEVGVDPNDATGNTLYASLLGNGVWRTVDGGANWTQIQPPLSAANFDRSEFALTKIAGGKTRMYLGQGSQNPPFPAARLFRTDDAAEAAPVFIDMTTAQNINYCTGQCWYDNVVYTPKGHPDVVYLLGSFDYNQKFAGQSNARGVLLSTDGGATWSDLTQDGDPNHAESTHPDQHAIVVSPNNPYQYWEGSDGGVVRSDGGFADVSYKCAQRGLTGADLSYCQSLLWRVPNQLASLNKDFSTLQYQSLSVSAQRPQNNAQGGTQDNGTFQYTGSPNVWYQEMYGDGGQSGFSAADDSLRFNTFTGQANDVNFRNGDPTKWVVATGPIVSSPEASYFYPPVTADPNAANGGTIFQGSFSVWRTQDWGGDRDYLEANCPEFTTSAANPACGDFVPIGPPGATDLTFIAYGFDRLFGAVAAIERAPGNTGTVWAATGTGRVFISDNADAAASSVIWTRIDTTAANDPGRFISSISVDPANPHHAWISYSGYDFNTPGFPGHVFDVTWDGVAATWTDLSYNLADLPITDLVRDDLTGDLYAASDFGVMRLANGSTTWTVAGTGLPAVEVPGLTIVPSARLLYAATHGRSAWVLQLP
ncbi:MAG TPA: exo-alpha-sialidase [Thermoanaerobaculia bacterium]|jgi:hypothetical protein